MHLTHLTTLRMLLVFILPIILLSGCALERRRPGPEYPFTVRFEIESVSVIEGMRVASMPEIGVAKLSCSINGKQEFGVALVDYILHPDSAVSTEGLSSQLRSGRNVELWLTPELAQKLLTDSAWRKAFMDLVNVDPANAHVLSAPYRTELDDGNYLSLVSYDHFLNAQSAYVARFLPNSFLRAKAEEQVRLESSGP